MQVLPVFGLGALALFATHPPDRFEPPRPLKADCRRPEQGEVRNVTIIDRAVYVAGERVSAGETLGETYQALQFGNGSGLAWIGLHRPTEAEFSSLATEFDLHALAVEDAVQAHQRPKVERYGETLFIVLKAARYVDVTEEVEFGELHVFVGKDFVVTVRHDEPGNLARVRSRLESDTELLRRGPEAVLYAILDRVVDDYVPVVDGLENDIDEIEVEVFRRDPAVSQRIYQLSREVVEFQRATRPLAAVMVALAAGFQKYDIDEELQRSLRDVQDHLVVVNDRIDGFRQSLQEILSVNATLVSEQQNEEMRRLTEVSVSQNEEVKKISAWAAIIFAPTLVGTIYGMNFDAMPELNEAWGYPAALALMVAVCLVLFLIFKRRDWL
ncbi:MAG: magnesium and cobalt transport protein CorA [Actinomycetota bacterium]